MSKVTSIGGEPRWAGEPMDDDEIGDMISYLGEVIADVTKGEIRGFTIACVSSNTPASGYRIAVKCKTGCSRLNLIGASYLAAHEAAALMSEVGKAEEVEE